MSSGDTGRDVESLVKEAKVSLGQRQYDRADETASQAIGLDARSAAAYLVRAEARRKLGRPDQALADLAVSIRLDPDRAAAYVVRAEILKKRCLFDQAIADATHALFLAPDNAAAYSIRADCRRAIGDLDGAAADAQELVRIDPTRPIGPQTIGAGQPRTAGTAPDDRFYKGAGTDRPDLRGDIFDDGKPADRSMKSRVIDDPDEAAEALALASGYRPGVIRPIPRSRWHLQRSARPAPWAVVILGGVALFGGGLLWAKKDQQKEAVPEKIVAAILPAADSGRAARPEPVAIQPVLDAVGNRPEVIPKQENGRAIATPDVGGGGDRKSRPDVGVPTETITHLPTTPATSRQADDSGDLQGDWVMVSEEVDGMVDKETQERRITIKGQDFVMSRTRSGQYGVYVGKILIDGAARSFDFEGKGPKGAHQEFKGIYEVEGDILRMCYVYSFGNDAKRPTRLRSYKVPGTATVSLVLKRVRGGPGK